MMPVKSVLEWLDTFTKEGWLYERVDDKTLRCIACAHRCLLKPGARGVCLVRRNQDGKLMVPWGYVSSLHNDPIEKKPLFHVLPTEGVLSFGMLGCNFRCPFCQNWEISQTGRDEVASQYASYIKRVTPEEMVELAERLGSQMIASTYNEPLITTEWAIDIFRLAKERGMLTVYVTNGHATPEVLDHLKEVLDAANVDLKAFKEESYRWLGGKLKPVLQTIEGMLERGIWVEVTTLVVPEFNDSDEELRGIANFLAKLSRDIPWHVTAFHPDYKVTDKPRTPSSLLLKAYDIGKEAGLRYVYMGNVLAPEYETTYCPSCGTPLIVRSWYDTQVHMREGGKCPKCGEKIPGIWRRRYPPRADDDLKVLKVLPSSEG